jgi:hypothetical protein
MSEVNMERLSSILIIVLAVILGSYWLFVANPEREARYWKAYDCASDTMEEEGGNFTVERHKAAYVECYKLQQEGGVR